MLKFLTYMLLNLADRLLQVVVPARSDYICYLSKPDYSDNAFYLYKHALQNRCNLKHIWLVRESALRSRIARDFAGWSPPESGNSLVVVSKLSLSGYCYFLRSRYVFHTHGGYAFSSWSLRRHIVSLWHGMPIKCIGTLNTVMPNPNLTFGTLHIATSRFFQYVMACAFNVPSSRVIVSGLPRCDILSRKEGFSAASASVREALGLQDDCKVVLWTPTYRTGVKRKNAKINRMRTFLDDTPEELIEEISRCAVAANMEVVVKLHPADALNYSNVTLKHKNIRVLRAPDWNDIDIPLYDFIAGVDALLSDVSSVLIDYLLTERPAGVIGFDKSTYTRDLVFSEDHFLKSKRVLHIMTAGDVKDFFRRVASGEINAPSGSDVSSVFHDELSESSSETILRSVGLSG